MLRDVTIGQYLPGDSLLHRLDPRSKINGVLFFMISLFVINNMVGYWLMVICSIALILLSRIPLKYFLKGLKPLILLILLTVVLQALLTPGEIIWQWKFLHVTKEGLIQALFMGTRLVILVSITSLLTLTTTPIVLTDGIEKMLNPFKPIGVPAHELAMMMTIALRFIPTLIEETEKIMKAQAARGADFESGNLIKRINALIPILVPLFLSAIQRAEDLATAMEARGYHGGEGRTRLKELRLSGKDYGAFIAAAILLLAAIATRLWF